MKIVKHEAKPVVTPPAMFDLIGLTEDDLKALITILRHVGGDPYGPRGIASRIEASAEVAGVPSRTYFPMHKGSGTIYFDDAKIAEQRIEDGRAAQQGSLAQVQAQRLSDLDVMGMRERAIRYGVPERLVR